MTSSNLPPYWKFMLKNFSGSWPSFVWDGGYSKLTWMRSGAACGIRYSRTVQHAIRLLAVVTGCCGSLKRQSHVWQSCRIELLFKTQLTCLVDTHSHDKPAHWSVLEFTHNSKTLGHFCTSYLDCDGKVLTEPALKFPKDVLSPIEASLYRTIKVNIRVCSSEWDVVGRNRFHCANRCIGRCAGGKKVMQLWEEWEHTCAKIRWQEWSGNSSFSHTSR